MIDFIGDLSIRDAEILEEHGRGRYVLEFGVGGSTQIFASVARGGVSFDTSQEWIARTASNLKKLGLSWQMHPYESRQHFAVPYDVVFVDGVDHLRGPFAIESWPLLKVGGVMIFHDTRRSPDAKNVTDLIQRYLLEVGVASFNHASSNMTIVLKKPAEPYVNWNHAEGKPMWRYGYGEPPDTWPEAR